MFWSDKLAEKIIDSGDFKPYWVDDMFTPSGFAHIGSLRGPLVHDAVYRSLIDKNTNAKSTYVFNDFDPVDGLPPEYAESQKTSLGLPLRTAPSPEPGFDNFAHFFTDDFKKVLTQLGIRAEFLSSWDMYHQGLFNDVIKTALDNADTIQDIYERVSGSKKRQAGWLPLQVICQKCGKLGTTRVYEWNGKTVKYKCEENMVAWAIGCGHEGEIGPFDGNGKLPWKVDWAAHWKVMGVTVEGAGKDHSSAGGSRDIAKEECKLVFHYPNPFNIPYEFFLIGGKKMSSSKGLGLKASNLIELLPAEVGRFLFLRTDYNQAIEFDPVSSMAIPDLFDEYDRCWQAYITGSDENLSRAFVLSQIQSVPPKTDLYIPRFRDVANYIQLPNVNLEKFFSESIGRALKKDEIKILAERKRYAEIWLEKYAPEDFKMIMTSTVPDAALSLTQHQKNYLKTVLDLIPKGLDPEILQKELYNLSKVQNIDAKTAFSSIYLSVLGKTHGPKAAWLLTQYPKDSIIKRFKMVIENKEELDRKNVAVYSNQAYFSIDPAVTSLFPSISVGVALIKDVKIGKSKPDLEKEKNNMIDKIRMNKLEDLNFKPELLSYRKLYKEMGIDWHSRRPSPEALLRRVMQGKELYTVNTCVDAYNLIVMKYGISVGAFDSDNISYPTVLRFAGKGDSILLLGDKEVTLYKDKELAYYDKKGGYNIDFNYRDSKRTMVTEDTRNIWINVDGIYDISPYEVERTLQESIDIIIKHCGGSLEFQGVIYDKR